MVDRRVAALVYLCVGGLSTTCEVGPTLEVGGPIPAFLFAEGTGPVVVWSVRPDDCLTCQDVTRTLRLLQRTVAPDVEIVVVVLGRNNGLVHSFLRVERIQATEIYLTGGEFVRHFGDIPVPFLAVSDRNKIVNVWAGRVQIAEAVFGHSSSLVSAVALLSAGS